MQKCKGMIFKGVTGSKTAEEFGYHPDFGKIYYIPGVPNLLSFGKVAQRKDVKIEYSRDRNCFDVTVGEAVYRFESRRGRDVYTCHLESQQNESYALWNGECAHAVEITEEKEVVTAEGRSRLLSKEQLERCRLVQRFKAALGYPSLANTLKMVKSGRVDGLNFGPGRRCCLRARDIWGSRRGDQREVRASEAQTDKV
jgi:hypothetical protein